MLKVLHKIKLDKILSLLIEKNCETSKVNIFNISQHWIHEAFEYHMLVFTINI